MITETLLNSLKSLFSSLGAKTSDSNYAVGLFDKTNGEPKGMMGMSDLASVLGVPLYSKVTIDSSIITSIQAAYESASYNTKFDGIITNVGYYLGMKGVSANGKAGVLLLCPNSTYILHRNFGSTTSGNWTVFKVIA